MQINISLMRSLITSFVSAAADIQMIPRSHKVIIRRLLNPLAKYGLGAPPSPPFGLLNIDYANSLQT